VKNLTKETLEKIREEIKSGKSKYRTAAEFGLHPTVVYRWTQDLPGGQYGWPGIRGKTLEILQELIKHGYILCTNFNAGHKYRILRKYFPNICKINMHSKTILFLEDKAPVAARAFLSDMNRKIMSFQELKQVTRVFGIELSSEEKHRIIGKPGKRMLPVIRRKDGGFLSSYHKSQMKLDDFNENYAFPHKSTSAKSQKIQSSNEDSLLTNDDSLIDFYIRKYCPQVVPKVATKHAKNE
jgi:hypothetical protein